MAFLFKKVTFEVTPVPIYELLPRNDSDPSWKTADYRARVVVRADSLERAREVADGNYSKGAALPPGTQTLLSPWRYGDIVECRELANSGFPEDGNEEILEPAYDEPERARVFDQSR